MRKEIITNCKVKELENTQISQKIEKEQYFD